MTPASLDTIVELCYDPGDVARLSAGSRRPGCLQPGVRRARCSGTERALDSVTSLAAAGQSGVTGRGRMGPWTWKGACSLKRGARSLKLGAL